MKHIKIRSKLTGRIIIIVRDRGGRPTQADTSKVKYNRKNKNWRAYE
jgi:galactose-1-phosphate uridylyltransferase